MCGICGQVNFEPEHPVSPEVLERMQLSLGHRGPDSQGTWIKDSIALAHTRLAIIDLSENGHQPMSNEDDTVFHLDPENSCKSSRLARTTVPQESQS